GVFVRIDNNPYLMFRGQLHRWTPFGYDKAIRSAAAQQVTVLTPRSSVNAIRAGYRPQIDK
ncbi:MAG: hypothetical protein ACHQF4_05520, partial [Sphingobacteriales bacterium]